MAATVVKEWGTPPGEFQCRCGQSGEILELHVRAAIRAPISMCLCLLIIPPLMMVVDMAYRFGPPFRCRSSALQPDDFLIHTCFGHRWYQCRGSGTTHARHTASYPLHTVLSKAWMEMHLYLLASFEVQSTNRQPGSERCLNTGVLRRAFPRSTIGVALPKIAPTFDGLFSARGWALNRHRRLVLDL